MEAKSDGTRNPNLKVTVDFHCHLSVCI